MNRAVLDYACAQPRAPALQHLPDGQEQHRAWLARHVDAITDEISGGRRRSLDRHPGTGTGAAAAPAAAEREAARVGGAAPARASRSARLHHPVGSARLSDGHRSSSTRCARSTCACGARHVRSTSPARTYPAGSFVVMTDQAFRPHVIDMFEPQDHPNVFPVPGGPPTPPYDNAGWTLALQMGVMFDRDARPVHRSVRTAHRLERRAAARSR